VPNEWLAAVHDYNLLDMLLVLAVAIPMYVCATGSIPIAVSLMAKGLTPGAALVLLMAGPAVNSASMLVIGKVFGRRTLWLYILSIVIGAVLFGLGIDYLLPQEWFAVQSRIMGACHHQAAGLSATDWIWMGLLAALLVNALGRQWWSTRHHRYECCCHEHHSDEAREAFIYSVSGMNCNHCKANVERAIRSVEGVEDVEVSLAAATATVTGRHDSEALIRQVKSFGYEAALKV
jgi:copper chaperone CopZ